VSELHNPDTTLWGWHTKDKKAFAHFDGDGRRIYGGTGRNSPKQAGGK